MTQTNSFATQTAMTINRVFGTMGLTLGLLLGVLGILQPAAAQPIALGDAALLPIAVGDNLEPATSEGFTKVGFKGHRGLRRRHFKGGRGFRGQRFGRHGFGGQRFGGRGFGRHGFGGQRFGGRGFGRHGFRGNRFGGRGFGHHFQQLYFYGHGNYYGSRGYYGHQYYYPPYYITPYWTVYAQPRARYIQPQETYAQPKVDYHRPVPTEAPLPPGCIMTREYQTRALLGGSTSMPMATPAYRLTALGNGGLRRSFPIDLKRLA